MRIQVIPNMGREERRVQGLDYIYCCSINEEPLLFCVYQTIVISKAEIEKQISTKTNSNERYYNKWKPLIEKKFVT